MRTAIFLGLFIVAMAINSEIAKNLVEVFETLKLWFYVILFLDIAEVITN